MVHNLQSEKNYVRSDAFRCHRDNVGLCRVLREKARGFARNGGESAGSRGSRGKEKEVDDVYEFLLRLLGRECEAGVCGTAEASCDRVQTGMNVKRAHESKKKKRKTEKKT